MGGKMNLQLYALRSGNRKQPTKQVQLVVVDLDKAHYYPLNFVCILPKYFRFIEKRPSQFVNIFGKRSPQVAKKLLAKAFNDEKDPEIRQVLKSRIRKLALAKENSEHNNSKCFTNSLRM